jgi:hypothetical protein
MGINHSSFFLPCEISAGNDLICFQVYSLTRVATLASVALNIYGVDFATPSQIKCQVCRAIRLRPYARFLMVAWFLKVTVSLQFVRSQTRQTVRKQSS